MSNLFLSIPTEVWEFPSGATKRINPTFKSGDYGYGTGLYAVNFDFCRK